MPQVLRMPEVAANATEAVLAQWLVAENADFAAMDTIATVETEKALVDVDAEAAGVVLKLLVQAGSQVEVGAPIAVLGAPDEAAADINALLNELGVVEPDDAPVDAPVDRVVPVRTFASPLARKLAKDARIPVETITGSGPGGRILRRDVDAAIASKSAPVPPVFETGAPAPVSKPPVPKPPVSKPVLAPGDEVPHTRLRRAIATRLVESKQTAPHFYLRATVRADRLVALRAEINEGAIRVSLNDLVVKAVAAAHVAVPAMNVIWTPDAVRSFTSVDVAVAVATDRGLITPVVRDVTSLSVTAIASRVRDLASRARDGTLRQEELEGGTISVTNLGMYGVEEFAAIINPPHAAILAVGAVREEPVVEAGAVVPGRLMSVTLSVDHRPVDGVAAGRWLAAVKELLENPLRILA